jgi:hypothetical protein
LARLGHIHDLKNPMSVNWQYEIQLLLTYF